MPYMDTQKEERMFELSDEMCSVIEDIAYEAKEIKKEADNDVIDIELFIKSTREKMEEIDGLLNELYAMRYPKECAADVC